MTVWLAPVLIGALLVSTAITLVVRRFALRRGMLDVPGPRSSHERPTPRGGGLGFVLVFCAALAGFAWALPAERALWAALLGGGLLVAGVGWWDDRRTLSSWSRLGFYGAASAWAVAWLGGLAGVDLGFSHLPIGTLGYPLAWAWIFCFTNVYNFMDGIDGLAAGEGLAVSAAAGALLLLHGDQELALLCWILSAALGGFIPWNWPPARVFMGDVGSNFLGFVFASLAVASENHGSLPVLVWGVLLLVFLVDGVATFFLRLMRGERVSVAHRSHAYQRAVQSGSSHTQVTSAVLMLDGVLIALAFATEWHPCVLLPVLLSSTGLLFLIWLRFACRKTRVRGGSQSDGL